MTTSIKTGSPSKDKNFDGPYWLFVRPTKYYDTHKARYTESLSHDEVTELRTALEKLSRKYGIKIAFALRNIRRQTRDNQIVGVYKHFNESGEVIYVGKGSLQRAHTSADKTPEHRNERVRIQWRACPNHATAYVIEAMLIRKYLPKYNHVGVSR